MKTQAFVDQLIASQDVESIPKKDSSGSIKLRYDGDRSPYVAIGDEYFYASTRDLRKMAKVFKAFADRIDEIHA